MCGQNLVWMSILLVVQLLCGWCAYKGVQEQRSQRNPIPKAPTNGGVFDIVGGRRLGYQRRTWEDRLEQSPFLFILQRFWHWGMPCARTSLMCLKHQQLVGRRFIPSPQRPWVSKIQVGSYQPHDLRLLHRQIPVPSSPTRVHRRLLSGLQWPKTMLVCTYIHISYLLSPTCPSTLINV